MIFPYAKLESLDFVTLYLKIVYSLIHSLESPQKNVVLAEWSASYTEQLWGLC